MEERLFRSRDKKVIAGVAGGISDYLHLDPVIVRLIFVLLFFFSGISFLIYIILWIVVPVTPITNGNSSTDTSSLSDEQSTGQNEISQNIASSESGKGRIVAGFILITVGAIFLTKQFFPFIDFKLIFPIILIILGVLLLGNTIKNQ